MKFPVRSCPITNSHKVSPPPPLQTKHRQGREVIKAAASNPWLLLNNSRGEEEGRRVLQWILPL